MKPTIYTPEVCKAIPVMVEEGKSREEIAAAIGTTCASLAVQCSKLRISLRKGIALPPSKRLNISLPKPILQELTKHAHDRGTETALLATQLLRVIVTDGLVRAVLDDQEGELA